ncbi:MAG: TonB-dependent receptor [Caulobacteraceae bacterium]|nr:TonB-dependent receptor [Caulobacteraceae bacterium]
MTPRRRRLTRVRSGLAWSAPLCAALIPVGALTATPRSVDYAIPAEPVSSAVIDFAVQSNVSIGSAQHCSGRSTPLVGRFTVEAGLARLLASTSCDFKVVAPGAFQLFERPRPVPAIALRGPKPAPTAPASPPPDPRSELIVTAAKRRTVIDELPAAVSAISARALRLSGARDATDITGGFAGVATTNLGPGRDKILLRGLSDGVFTGRTQSTVGIYLDDTPVTYNAPDPDLRLTDVESVEITRGPQGSLFGGGSMSGVYHIVSRKPVLGQFGGSIMAGGSLTDAGAPSSEAEGVVNIPLLSDRAAVRVTAYTEQDGGFINDVLLNQSNVDGARRSGGRLSFRARLGAGWTLTAGAATQAIHSNDTQYVTASLGNFHRANQIREASSNQFDEGYVTLEREGGFGDFKSTTSVVSRHLSSTTDASTALPLFGTSVAKVGAFEEPISAKTLVEDATLSSPHAGRLQWLVGAFGSMTFETTDSYVYAGPGAKTGGELLYRENRTDHLGDAAIYGEASYRLSDRLTITAGLRESISTVETRSMVTAPLSRRHRRFARYESFSRLSPKFAIDYELTNNTRLYALVSQGWRAGGYNTGGLIGTGFASNPNAKGPHRRFGVDQIVNYEIGVKSRLFDDRLRLTSSLFYDDWTNIQTDQFMSSGLSYTANAGDGRNYGLETELAFRPTDNLTFEANALLDQPELTRPRPGFAFGAHTGLPGVPDASAGVRATYQWTIGANLTATASVEAQYIGRSNVTFNPSLAPTMGGYVMDRINTQLIGKGWRLGVDILNPTGERGDTFAYGNPFNFRKIAESTPQRPRTVRMTLSLDF